MSDDTNCIALLVDCSFEVGGGEGAATNSQCVHYAHGQSMNS